MGSTPIYLKQNVLAEPLVMQWYAWAGLMNPATAAMYVANSHVKIMQSFVSTPQIHINALKNPKMRGGPFIHYDQKKVNEIKELLARTMEKQEPLLKLADAIKSLDELLEREADGSSVEPLYEKVPDALKGYVELVYDLNSRPTARLIEGLLYKSPYYSPELQSIALSLSRDDDRFFAFSTPRLRNGDRVYLDMPFSDERLDALFKMKEVPQTFDYIKELLNVKDEDDELFSSFFTEQPFERRTRYEGDGVRICYLGHACVLIQSKDVNILCDPVISYKHENGIARYTYADLPDTIDYVLITHSHQDHCMFETLLQLRHKIKNVIVPRNGAGALPDPSIKLALQNIGFDKVIEVEEMETIEIEGGEIISLPFLGEHADLNIRTKTAFFIRIEGKTIMCAADSNNLEPRMYEHIHRAIGDVDVIFIGMECDGAPLTWIYGSLLTKPLARRLDQSRRLNGSDYERAMKLVSQLNPKQVYVYAMGQEPWLTYVTSIQYDDASRPIIESNKLIEDCKARGLVAERLFGRKDILLNDN